MHACSAIHMYLHMQRKTHVDTHAKLACMHAHMQTFSSKKIIQDFIIVRDITFTNLFYIILKDIIDQQELLQKKFYKKL